MIAEAPADGRRGYFVSLGCPKNQLDTEVMLGCLAASGYGIAEELADADIAVVNTCSFIGSAREESIEAILEVADLRESGSLRSLVVAGCLPQRYGGVDHTQVVKHYMSAPQREWLKGPTYNQVNRYLDDGALAASGLIDYKSWKTAYADYAKSPELGNSFFVWKMINLEAMLREFFGGKAG